MAGAVPSAVAILDLDGFNQVNDSVGHDAGDRLLQAVAHQLAAAFPEAVAARLGGEEFAILIGVQLQEVAAMALERLLHMLPGHLEERGLSAVVRLCAGLTTAPETTRTKSTPVL